MNALAPRIGSDEIDPLAADRPCRDQVSCSAPAIEATRMLAHQPPVMAATCSWRSSPGAPAGLITCEAARASKEINTRLVPFMGPKHNKCGS